jgi:uncharacterized phage protein (TIGR02218 family)
MQTLSSSLVTSLNSASLTLAHGYILTRNDGVKICFTNHDCDIIVVGNLFSATKPLDIGHGEKNNGFGSDSNLLLGGFEIGGIEENDIKLGKWENAKVEIIIFDWQNPNNFTTIFNGFINTINQSDNGFEFELAGQKQQFQNQIGRTISRNCDALLGDAKCGINLLAAGHFVDVALLGNNSADYIETNANDINADDYIYGKIVFNSGALSGYKIGIKNIVKNNASTLIFPDTPLPISPILGDLVTLFKGCDKSFATCKTRFLNGDNFRGCPHLPGQSDVSSGPAVSGNTGGKRA